MSKYEFENPTKKCSKSCSMFSRVFLHMVTETHLLLCIQIHILMTQYVAHCCTNIFAPAAESLA